MEHNQIIHREFSKQASSFGDKGLTLSNQDILDWSVGLLPLDKEFQVLDVATGTGHLSRAIAPHVKSVAAIDLTPKILAYAREEKERSRLINISIEEGKAENLPHGSDCFNLVVSRLAIHHFEKPMIQLREMVRVCKPRHWIGLIDLIAPEIKRLAETFALSKKHMAKLLSDAGLVVDKFDLRDIEVDFRRWVQMTETSPDAVEIIKEELLKDVSGGSKTGMRPFMKNGELKFLQVWSVVIGIKH